MFKQQPFEAYLDELTVITILIPNDVVHERAPLFFYVIKNKQHTV